MAELYTAQEDIIGTKEDGRTYLILKKGQTLPMEKAIALGLVKEPKWAQPAETKGKPSAEQDPTNPPDPPKGKQGK